MKNILSFAGAVCAASLLSACGESGPSKGELKESINSEGLSVYKCYSEEHGRSDYGFMDKVSEIEVLQRGEKMLQVQHRDEKRDYWPMELNITGTCHFNNFPQWGSGKVSDYKIRVKAWVDPYGKLFVYKD